MQKSKARPDKRCELRNVSIRRCDPSGNWGAGERSLFAIFGLATLWLTIEIASMD